MGQTRLWLGQVTRQQRDAVQIADLLLQLEVLRLDLRLADLQRDRQSEEIIRYGDLVAGLKAEVAYLHKQLGMDVAS